MKLWTKVTALVWGFILLFSALVIWNVNWRVTQQMHLVESEWTKALSEALAEGISRDTINGELLDVRETLRAAVESNPRLAYAYVTDFGGEIFTHSFDQGFPKQLLALHGKHNNVRDSIEIATSEGKHIVQRSYPLISGMDAAIHIGVDQSSLHESLKATLTTIVVTSVGIALLGALISMLLARRFSRPLERLATEMSHYGTGSDVAFLDVAESGSDLSQVIQGFNNMIRDRRRIDEELERHRHHLGYLVAERTKQLEAAKTEAETANRAKSEFLSRMSHELRTPLNAILGFGQLMELDKGLNPQQHDYTQEILRAGEHLLELINEVLDLARIESGRIQLDLQPISIRGLLEQSLSTVTPMARERGIHLTMNYTPSNECTVLAEQTRLKGVLLNLLSNAIKYNRDDGSVVMQCDLEGSEEVRISVVDTGPGLTPAEQELIFEPFRRLDSKHSEVEGTGIGLTIARHVVQLMGGSLVVESEPGQGSRFQVRLPIAQASTLSAELVGKGDGGIYI